MADAARDEDWQPTADAVDEAAHLVAKHLRLPNPNVLNLRHYYFDGGALCGAEVPSHTLWLEPLLVDGRVRLSQSVQCIDCDKEARLAQSDDAARREALERHLEGALVDFLKK